MSPKITKKRISEDELEIYVDGEHIGNISFGWLRIGGAGWTKIGWVQTYRTQKEAIKRLMRETKNLKNSQDFYGVNR